MANGEFVRFTSSQFIMTTLWELNLESPFAISIIYSPDAAFRYDRFCSLSVVTRPAPVRAYT